MADEELELDDTPEVGAPEEEVSTADESTADEPEQDQPETEPEPDLAAEPERQPAPEPRQPSRAENRIRTLTEQIRERDTRLAETNRRIDELIARQSQPQPQAPRETPEQRAARFALMTPQEQIAETLRESEARWEQRMQGFAMQSAETADRTAFQAKCAVDPLYAKWAPKVEGRLAELRTKGTNLEREVLLKFLIGEAALERRGSKEGKREVRQAERRVTAARTRPANSGSDQPSQRRQNQSLERRLENVNI